MLRAGRLPAKVLSVLGRARLPMQVNTVLRHMVCSFTPFIYWPQLWFCVTSADWRNNTNAIATTAHAYSNVSDVAILLRMLFCGTLIQISSFPNSPRVGHMQKKARVQRSAIVSYAYAITSECYLCYWVRFSLCFWFGMCLAIGVGDWWKEPSAWVFSRTAIVNTVSKTARNRITTLTFGIYISIQATVATIGSARTPVTRAGPRRHPNDGHNTTA